MSFLWSVKCKRVRHNHTFTHWSSLQWMRTSAITIHHYIYCFLKFYDLSCHKLWLQENMPDIFHCFTLDLNTHSYLHPARASGVAKWLCHFSTDTSWQQLDTINVKYTNETCPCSYEVVSSGQSGWFKLCRWVFNSFHWQRALLRIFKTADLLLLIVATSSLLHYHYIIITYFYTIIAYNHIFLCIITSSL